MTDTKQIQSNKTRTYPRQVGFTLLEVTLSITIVGIAIVAMMMLFASGTQINAAGNDLSTGVYLAEQIRSLTDQTDYDSLLAMNGNTYNGIDAEGNPVIGMNRFQQQLSVQEINPVTMTPESGTDALLVTVTVTDTGSNSELTRLSWLRVR